MKRELSKVELTLISGGSKDKDTTESNDTYEAQTALGGTKQPPPTANLTGS